MNTTKSIFASAALAFSTYSFAQIQTPLSPVGEPETAKIISVVSSIPMAVDLAAYDLAEKAFAPKVTIDYTSLWGGQPNAMTPAELMTAWRGIVPGFDATWHELSNVKATVNGNKAKASAFVDGRHWLGEQLWRPIGNYHWDLEKINGQWKVTRMQFAMTQELGNRDVATKAMEIAKTRATK
jgi:hypothetical protein